LNQATTRKSAWLIEHANDVFTQTGEDGIIAKILEIIPETDQWCVEFGAWDGIHLSNTRNLILNSDYHAVLIEGSESKSKELATNYKAYPGVTPINAFVGYTKDDNLDTLLAETDIPGDFDFLSIDVDGNDYHIWKAMSRYQPKIVCIEYNPTLASGVHFVQEAGPSVMHGSSPSAIEALGKEKGYSLVCVTDLNLIFVKDEYFPLFEIEDHSLATLRPNENFVTHLFCGYDGRILLQGSKRMPWHGIEIKPPMLDENMLEQIPESLQRFPDNYSFIQKLRFKVFKTLRKISGFN
jgi:Methyltransferase FkbM domain